MSGTTFPFETPYHVAYAVVALIYVGYAISLWRRGKNARARLEQLTARGSGRD